MTNAQIIENAKALNGIEEECHTFARWKQMGYKVRKGEHAAFKATIWKCNPKREIVEGVDPKTGEKVQDEATVNRMFMKTAHFFKRSQVEAVA